MYDNFLVAYSQCVWLSLIVIFLFFSQQLLSTPACMTAT